MGGGVTQGPLGLNSSHVCECSRAVMPELGAVHWVVLCCDYSKSCNLCSTVDLLGGSMRPLANRTFGQGAGPSSSVDKSQASPAKSNICKENKSRIKVDLDCFQCRFSDCLLVKATLLHICGQKRYKSTSFFTFAALV